MDGDGDGEERASPPPVVFPDIPISQPSSFLFTPSFPSSSILHPPPPLLPPPQAQQILTDIDWISLLSAQTGLSEHYPEADQTSSVILAEDEKGDGGGGGGNDKRKGGAGRRSSRKASRPRFAFQTRSVDDILDDGYRWRKYGQKAVKNSIYPRFEYSFSFSSISACMLFFLIAPHVKASQIFDCIPPIK